MTTTTGTDKSESESLDDFLSDDRVQAFLNRGEIEPSEVEWFAKTHIGMDRELDLPDETLGAVSLMFLTGATWHTKDVRGIDGEKQLLRALGYDSALPGPAKWERLHARVKDELGFTKAVLCEVAKLHAHTGNVDQRLILAYGEVRGDKELGLDIEKQKVRRIAERHDVSFSELLQFGQDVEEEYDE